MPSKYGFPNGPRNTSTQTKQPGANTQPSGAETQATLKTDFYREFFRNRSNDLIITGSHPTNETIDTQDKHTRILWENAERKRILAALYEILTDFIDTTDLDPNFKRVLISFKGKTPNVHLETNSTAWDRISRNHQQLLVSTIENIVDVDVHIINKPDAQVTDTSGAALNPYEKVLRLLYKTIADFSKENSLDPPFKYETESVDLRTETPTIHLEIERTAWDRLGRDLQQLLIAALTSNLDAQVTIAKPTKHRNIAPIPKSDPLLLSRPALVSGPVLSILLRNPSGNGAPENSSHHLTATKEYRRRRIIDTAYSIIQELVEKAEAKTAHELSMGTDLLERIKLIFEVTDAPTEGAEEAEFDKLKLTVDLTNNVPLLHVTVKESMWSSLRLDEQQLADILEAATGAKVHIVIKPGRRIEDTLEARLLRPNWSQ